MSQIAEKQGLAGEGEYMADLKGVDKSVYCVVADDRVPWIEKFDVAGLRGDIDDEELREWVEQLDKNRRTMVKAVPTFQHCTLFKWEMARRRFLHEQVTPEAQRNYSLRDDERRVKASQVLMDSSKAGGQVLTEVLDLSKTNGVSDVDHDTLSKFAILVAAEIDSAATNVLTSLHYDEGKIYGMGITFTKEEGKPALVTEVKPERVDLKDTLIANKTRIIAINGQSTISMSEGEVRNALRGPAGSIMEMTIQTVGNKTPFKIKSARSWISAGLK